ncbi:MAG: GIY-YIG nuclease family protein [Moraxellaceae bacterium]|nr:GIY-YIG nuclease family protein [Moraxellaceae bacterium]
MNIKQVLDEMFSKPSALGNINYQIKQPMLLSEGMAQVYHAWELSGVYLLLEHQESKNWNVPLEQASGKLLYVGKTQKNLCERIKSHFGMKNLTVETFENHRWHSVPSISDDVKINFLKEKL